jgi:hypothetical protein
MVCAELSATILDLGAHFICSRDAAILFYRECGAFHAPHLGTRLSHLDIDSGFLSAISVNGGKFTMKASIKLTLVLFMFLVTWHLNHTRISAAQNYVCGGSGLPPYSVCYEPPPGPNGQFGYCESIHGDEFWDAVDCCCRSDIANTCKPSVYDRDDCIDEPEGGCSVLIPGTFWSTARCCCFSPSVGACLGTPIIFDLNNDGYHLTDDKTGAVFDLQNTGHPRQWSWTGEAEDEAFLVLDRNGDGLINTPTELFGNVTPQPPTDEPNGFTGMAVFDTNGDKTIDARDPIYAQLRLWMDANHDGISQPGEIFALPAKGVTSISIEYRLSKRSDRFGNLFRYKAKSIINGQERWVWDVFLFRR